MGKIEKKAAKKYWLFLLVILLIAGFFYWFQLRPSNIRSFCDTEARNKARESSGESSIKVYNAIYEACLHKSGLK